MSVFRTACVFAITGFLVLGTVAGAHEVEKGPNGGRVADAGEYHVELVTSGNRIEVFLTDHDDTPVSAAAHSGLAILAIDGKSRRIALSPAGEILAGSVESNIQGEPKGVVQITPPKGKMVQARFN